MPYLIFMFTTLCYLLRQPAKPIASAIAGAAASGMLDTRTVRIDTSRRHSLAATDAIEKERQRKFLLQVHKSRLLAAAQILQSSNVETRRNSILSAAPQNMSSEMAGE